MKFIIYLCLLISIFADKEFTQLKIYLNAKENIGETAWAKDNERQAKRNEGVFFKAGEWKCNLFVYEIILVSGYDIGTPNKMSCFKHPILCVRKKTKRPPCASDWYNETVEGFTLIGEGEEGRKLCKAGDIMTDGTHMGIVSEGKQTISATDKEIVQNDWGFREDNTNVKIFRFDG